MCTKLQKEFFERDATEVAPKLLGKILCMHVGDEIIRIRITETEAYMPEDPYCHGKKNGKKPNNLPQFESGGITYLHPQHGYGLDIVTGSTSGEPQSVLIRAGELLSNNGIYLGGPARLTKLGLKITKENKHKFHWISLQGDKIYICEDNNAVGETEYYCDKRKLGDQKQIIEPYFSIPWNFKCKN